MKKILTALLVITMLLVFVLTGCRNGISTSTWTQGTASAEIEPYARKAIEIIDNYLSFNLSAESATNEFKALYRRIEPYDIRGIDSTYSEPDQTIAYIIDSLAIFDADKRSDLEYHQYRDILAFQIGEAVSGKNYDAKHSGLEECPKMTELLNAGALPLDFATEHNYAASWYWSMTFDEMNGVSLSDFQSYIESIYSAILSSDINNTSISFYYSRYEQNVFKVSLHIVDSGLTASVYRTDEQALNASEKFLKKYTTEEIRAMDEYPKEFAILNPLYEFVSIEQLPDAIAVARTFSGIK